MKYLDALSLWGAKKLANTFSPSGWSHFTDIKTSIETIEGSNSGNFNDDSWGDNISPETNIVIRGVGVSRKGKSSSLETRVSINEYSGEFDLEIFLKELLEYSGGSIRY